MDLSSSLGQAPTNPTSPTAATTATTTVVTPIPASQIDSTFSSTSTNLTSSVLGASVIGFSDEYFASAANLLEPRPPVRRAGVYVHTGAWYDGWETRRHNLRAFDWVVVRLGCVAVVEGVEVDTAFFVGNEAPAVGVDGCRYDASTTVSSPLPAGREKMVESEEDGSALAREDLDGWDEILPRRPCGPSQRQAWKVGVAAAGSGGVALDRRPKYTHLRLKMYPDGGIARLRVYGHAVPPPLPPTPADQVGEGQNPVEELSSALNGGIAISCSDQHFGVKSNLLLPSRGADMGDGWETARSRTRGHVDWVICRLGLKGRRVDRVLVDTKDFRGNYPQAIKVEGWFEQDQDEEDEGVEDPEASSKGWIDLVKGERSCRADTEHVYHGDDLLDLPGSDDRILTHVKLTIIPDGGVKRLRIFGRRA